MIRTLRFGHRAVRRARPRSPSSPKQPLPLKLDPKKTTPAITTADLMTRIYRFADDSMRGRMAGSPEAMKGTEYIAGELKRLGLQPAGDKRHVLPGRAVRRSDDRLIVDHSDRRDDAQGRTGLRRECAARDATDQSRTLEVIFGGQAIDTTNMLTPDQVRGKLLVLRPASGPPSDIQAFLASDGYKRYQAVVGTAAMIADDRSGAIAA